MEKARIKPKFKTNIVNKEDYPEIVRRMILHEAFTYTISRFAERENLGFCLVCGRWFISRVSHIRACSKKCRNYLNHAFHRLRKKDFAYASRRLRKTPLYYFAYIAVKEGILPPQVVGEENPDDLPTPLWTPDDFVKAFGLPLPDFVKEIAKGVKENQKAEKIENTLSTRVCASTVS